MAETKLCPYCAEEIKAEATRCRYCRSRLMAVDPQRWHRSHPEKKLAGVCAALAHVLVVPVAAIRLGFVILTLFHLLGPIVYGLLWLVIPARAGQESLLERVLQVALSFASAAGGKRSHSNQPPSAPPQVTGSSS
jgi:phage shock protein PspC (stress-responsive transcriptional regulator)